MALTRHRFIVLFAALLVFYVFAPVAQELRENQPGWPPVLEGVLFLALLTGMILSIIRARTGLWFAVGLALPSAVLWIVNNWAASAGLMIAREVFGAAFLIYTIAVVLRYVFHSQHVTYDTVCASLCVYLLLGVLWAQVYSIHEELRPGAFTLSEGKTPLRSVAEGDTRFLYFSFVTLTTLGYGDIVPTTPIGRMLAGLEAIIGQLYLVVLVSRLVGLEIAESIERRKTEGPAPNNEDDAEA